MTEDQAAAAEKKIRSNERIRETGGAPVTRVVCQPASAGGIACQFELENGRRGSAAFDSELREGAWFITD
jgi:hypothetical protein